jgi:hypothetical protein
MDSNAVALLAAGIPAAVAAVTFAITQWVTFRTASRNRVNESLATVMSSLEKVPLHLAKPRLLRLWSEPDLEIAFSVTRLMVVIPHRDRVLWQRLSVQAVELAHAKGDDRVRISGQMTSNIVLYLSKRKIAMKMLKEIAAQSPDTGDYF